MSRPEDDDDRRDFADAPPAAEYALGVLTPDEEERIRDQAAGDPSLRAQISLWEQHLSHFADDLPGIAPPDGVWRSIRRGMAADSIGGATAPQSVLPSRSQLWEDAAFWRQLAFLSTALAAIACVVALTAVFGSEGGPPQRRLVAALAGRGEGRAAFTATYDPLRHQMLIVPASLVRDADRVPELWLVTRDKRTLPLGIIDAEQPRAVLIPPALIAETSAGAALVITLEPPGGAPGGIATGPAIAKGELAPI